MLTTLSKMAFLLACTAVVYEDFKYRRFHVVWFFVAVAGAVVFTYLSHNALVLWTDALLNLICITANLIFLQAYALYKEGQFKFVIDRWLGIGDLMIWILLAFLFDPLEFLIFFVSTIMCTLVIVATSRALDITSFKTVPLAGFQVGGLLLLDLLHVFHWDILPSYKLL